MDAKANRWRPGAVTRRLILLPVLVVGLCLAFTGAASASAPFQASVSSVLTLPSGGCPNLGEYACGTANLGPGYGAATWAFYPNYIAVQTSCGSTYWATTYFTLLSDPSSTLALYESGNHNLCGPGLNANGYFKEGLKSYGHPQTALGTWSTITTAADCSIIPPSPPEQFALPCHASTGLFAGMGGSGTDTLNFAGARGSGSYTGTLG